MKTYRSAVDPWVAAAIAVAPLAVIAAAVGSSVSGAPDAAVVGWVVVIGVAALYALVVWPIAYELHPTELVVRFGRMRMRIPYRDIREVKPSRSVVAAPSYSMKRLAIHRGARRMPVLVSPADRDQFLLELASLTPHLDRTGDRLGPAAARA